MARVRKISALCAAIAGVLPAASFAAVDGTVDNGEYANSNLQNNGTGFGDNLNELDGAYYTYTPGAALNMAFTGNLEPNASSNGFVIWLDSRAGGATASIAPGASNVLGSFGGRYSGAWSSNNNAGGSILSPGFNPEYAIEVEHYGPNNQVYYHVIDLIVAPNTTNSDIYLGLNNVNGAQQDDTYYRDGGNTDAGHVLHAFDNTNTAGVTDTDTSNPGSATTGFEFEFSPEFLVRTNGHAIRALAFITNTDGSYLSNQFLPGLGGGATSLGGPGDPGGTPLFDSRGYHFNEMYITLWEPTWQGSDGVWGTASNWEGNFAPDGVDNSAKFGSAGNHSVTLAADVTLGTLKFDDSTSYTIGTNGDGRTITMNAGLAGARIDVFQGTHTIDSTLKFSSETLLNFAAATLNLNGVDDSAGKTLTVKGIGILNINGTQTYAANTQMNLDSGTVSFNSDAGPVGATLKIGVGILSAATVNFTVAQHLLELDVHGGSNANFTAATSNITNLFGFGIVDLTPTALTVNGGSFNGAFTGSGSVTKDSTNTLTLYGASFHTGGVTVSAGTLAMGIDNALPNLSNVGGPVTVAGGTLDIAATNQTASTVTLAGGSITGSTGILTATSSLDVQSGSASAILAGSVALTKTTSGAVTLTGANTYNGGTVISAGTLIAGDANLGDATGGLTFSGGSLQPPAATSTSRNLTVAAAGGALDATNGTVTVTGDGNTTWSGGNLTVTGGTVQLNRSGVGTVAVSPGSAITINAGATLELNGSDALSAGANHVDVVNNSTTSLHVIGGNHGVGNLDGIGNTTIDSGATLTAHRIRQDGLTVNGTANIRSTATGTTPAAEVGTVNSTSVITNGATDFSVGAGGTIDLANNDLVVRGGTLGTLTGTTYSGITGLIQSGRTTGGGWTGTGITSSTAALHVSNMALGVMRASDNGITSFSGVTGLNSTTTGAADVLVKYTYAGDADLSGTVNFDDFNKFLAGFNHTKPASWFTGDFNYSGAVDFDDFNKLVAGQTLFNANPTAVLSPAERSQLAAFASAGPLVLDGGASAAPEPGSLGVLAFAGAGLLARRRKKMN